MKGIQLWFKALPPTTRMLVIIATALMLYLIYKRITGFVETLGMGSKEKGQINGYQAQGQKASFSKTQFQNFANNLYKAMKGANIFDIPTRNKTVYGIFKKMNNDLDVALLEQAFGLRDGYDLQAWLIGEKFLDINVINNHFSSKQIEKQY